MKVRFKEITKEEYYDLVYNMPKNVRYNEFKIKWFNCFYYILKDFKLGYNMKIIKSLFYHFQMDNWKDLHLANSIYKGFSEKKLREELLSELSYCADRMTYDRLFRVHWLFKQVFKTEMTEEWIHEKLLSDYHTEMVLTEFKAFEAKGKELITVIKFIVEELESNPFIKFPKVNRIMNAYNKYLSEDELNQMSQLKEIFKSKKKEIDLNYL